MPGDLLCYVIFSDSITPNNFDVAYALQYTLANERKIYAG